MTPTEQDLARELARHPGWKWLPGMLAAHDRWDDARVYKIAHGTHVYATADYYDGEDPGVDETYYPDLADPATQGCLMGAILAATGERQILELTWDGSEFTVVDMTCVENGKRTGHWHIGWPSQYGEETTYGSAVAELWLAVNGGSNGNR